MAGGTISTANLNNGIDRLNLDLAVASGYGSVEEWEAAGGTPLLPWEDTSDIDNRYRP